MWDFFTRSENSKLKTQNSELKTRGRRRYIDCARGLAVLLMIEAHTTDAWTRAAAKGSIAFRDATILGGFAAPLFLWLAGIGIALSSVQTTAVSADGPRALRHSSKGRSPDRSGRGRTVARICTRGLEIFVLAFLFRLQAFIVSPGSPAIALLRVDILNIMGPAIVLAGIACALPRTTTQGVALYAAGAAAVVMSTPLVRAAGWVDALPAWMQWYLRPAGEHTTFTAFPWIGFVFAGAASGALLAAARDIAMERRIHAVSCGVGAVLVALGCVTATRPSIYAASGFWTSSPTWFAIRVGILMIVLGAFYAAGVARHPAMAAWQQPLAKIGRHSLFVYWIHVELVYGYASWLWRGRLPLWGTAVTATLFAGLMYYAVLLRMRMFPANASAVQAAAEAANT